MALFWSTEMNPVLVTTRGSYSKGRIQSVHGSGIWKRHARAMHHQIDACVMCQSLTDEERRVFRNGTCPPTRESNVRSRPFAEIEAPIEGWIYSRAGGLPRLSMQ